jgi:hypothetical protein
MDLANVGIAFVICTGDWNSWFGSGTSRMDGGGGDEGVVRRRRDGV